LVYAATEERARQVAQDEAAAEVRAYHGRDLRLWENEKYTRCTEVPLDVQRMVDKHLADPKRVRMAAGHDLEFISDFE
jgi:hypothetical protein